MMLDNILSLSVFSLYTDKVFKLLPCWFKIKSLRPLLSYEIYSEYTVNISTYGINILTLNVVANNLAAMIIQ